MLRLDIFKRSSTFIEKLPSKQARQILTKIQALRTDPQPPDTILLKGHHPLRRADIGEYRIVYFVKEDLLNIVLVGKRNDDEIYKQLKRL
jgi:mRNA interferase RelE/StbE